MKTIRGRVVAAVLFGVVVGALAILAFTSHLYGRTLGFLTSDALASAEISFEGLRSARIDKMHALAEATMKSEEIQKAFEERDREELMRISFPRFEFYRDTFGVTRWYYYEPDDEGTVFLRVYRGSEGLEESAFGDTSGSQALVLARETGTVSSGFELGRRALSVRVIAPFVTLDGRVLGYMGFGERVEDYLSVISGRTGDEYAMFLSKQSLEQEAWGTYRAGRGLPDNWDDREDVVLAESTVTDESVLGFVDVDALADESRPLGTLRSGGRSLAVGTTPILDVTGEPVGQVAVFRDVTDLHSDLRAAQLTLVLAFIAFGLVLAVVIMLVLERVVFSRIAAMSSDLERMSLAVASGEWGAIGREPSGSEDEIGRFERFFGSFLCLIAAALRASSRGDGERDADDR